MYINENENIIDSRDIIRRIDELNYIKGDWNYLVEKYMETEAMAVAAEKANEETGFTHEERHELSELLELQRECNYGDWHHGESLIADSYFETYMDYMVAGCYSIPDLPSFMTLTINYDELREDYNEVDFRGHTFYIRA